MTLIMSAPRDECVCEQLISSNWVMMFLLRCLPPHRISPNKSCLNSYKLQVAHPFDVTQLSNYRGRDYSRRFRTYSRWGGGDLSPSMIDFSKWFPLLFIENFFKNFSRKKILGNSANKKRFKLICPEGIR
jgi:hypothetical protein